MSGRNDTLVRTEMLTESVNAILSKVKLDRTFDIPYLAGYSLDRSRIYIDQHLAPFFTDHCGRNHSVDRFLILHEATEKALIDTWRLKYQHAHQIALRAEEAAVRAAGIEWRDYDRFMQQWIKRADSQKITRVPANLDLTPYFDENDYPLIQVMRKAMV